MEELFRKRKYIYFAVELIKKTKLRFQERKVCVRVELILPRTAKTFIISFTIRL